MQVPGGRFRGRRWGWSSLGLLESCRRHTATPTHSFRVLHVIETRRFQNDRTDQTSVRLAQAQEVFGIHRVTFYRSAAAGQIRTHKKFESLLLKVSEIEAFLENRTKLLQDVASQCASTLGAAGKAAFHFPAFSAT